MDFGALMDGGSPAGSSPAGAGPVSSGASSGVTFGPVLGRVNGWSTGTGAETWLPVAAVALVVVLALVVLLKD